MTLNATEWDERVRSGQGHLLQTWAWGNLKSGFGWTPVRLQTPGAAAQILFRRLPLGLTIAYIPKGPVMNWADARLCQSFFAAAHTEARRRRAIFLKVEPDVEQANSGPAQDATAVLGRAGFIPGDTIQPRTSLVVDISGSKAEILAAMKQKTRYNIRLAEKKGVVVRQGGATDVDIFYRLALTTADRNSFGVHSLAYYRAAYNLFAPDRGALFIAEFSGEPVAGLMAFCQGASAYYFYGASAGKYRNLMAPYLVQWAAICWAKSRGCTRYDLWGIPDEELATLEAEFQHRRDGLWGVYRFKRGFGGRFVQSVGAFDYVYHPLLYRLYRLRRGF